MQGIVFCSSQKHCDDGQQYMQPVTQELLNAVANNFEVPLLIVVNQYTGDAGWNSVKLKLDRKWFE